MQGFPSNSPISCFCGSENRRASSQVWEEEGRRSSEHEDNDCSVLFIFNKQRSSSKTCLKMNGTIWPHLISQKQVVCFLKPAKRRPHSPSVILEMEESGRSQFISAWQEAEFLLWPLQNTVSQILAHVWGPFSYLWSPHKGRSGGRGRALCELCAAVSPGSFMWPLCTWYDRWPTWSEGGLGSFCALYMTGIDYWLLQRDLNIPFWTKSSV